MEFVRCVGFALGGDDATQRFDRAQEIALRNSSQSLTP
jgi:hypothetical protein